MALRGENREAAARDHTGRVDTTHGECRPRPRWGRRLTGCPMTRYLAAACQTDFPNPTDRSAIPDRVDHMLAMIERAVVGYRPFGDVRLVAFPEFGHAAPIYATVEELRDLLAVPVPNEHTDRYHKKA